MFSSVDFRAIRRGSAFLLLACATAGMLGGCAGNTQLVDMWRDPTALSRPIGKMLVVAIRRDETSYFSRPGVFTNAKYMGGAP